MKYKLVLFSVLVFGLVSGASSQLTATDSYEAGWRQTHGDIEHVGGTSYIGVGNYIASGNNQWVTVGKLDVYDNNTLGPTNYNFLTESNQRLQSNTDFNNNSDTFAFTRTTNIQDNILLNVTDSNLNPIFTKTRNKGDGGTSMPLSADVKVMDDGSVYWISPDLTDTYMAHYDSSGTLQWEKTFTDYFGSDEMYYLDSENKFILTTNGNANNMSQIYLSNKSRREIEHNADPGFTNADRYYTTRTAYNKPDDIAYNIETVSETGDNYVRSFDPDTGEVYNEYYISQLNNKAYDDVHYSPEYDQIVISKSAVAIADQTLHTIDVSTDGKNLSYVSSIDPPSSGSYGGVARPVVGKSYPTYLNFGPEKTSLLIKDVPPKVENIRPVPTDPLVGESVDVLADVSSASRTIVNVTVDVYLDGALQNQSVSMSDSNGDGTYEATDVFTAEAGSYTLNVSGTDSIDRTTTESTTFEVTNRPPSVDSVAISPSDPLLGTFINASATVSDPEGNIASVDYELFEGGTSVATGAMSYDGTEWTADNIYNVSGETQYELTITATDGASNSDSNSLTFYPSESPEFSLVKPDNETIFTGSGGVYVEWEYGGGNTYEEGQFELVLDGAQIDTLPYDQFSSDPRTNTHVETNVNQGTHTWTVRFDSDTTGNVYQSEQRKFYVKEAAVTTNHQGPVGAETFNLDFGGSTDVQFNWTEDSTGFGGSYYTVFTLVDGTGSTVSESTSVDLSGDTTRQQSETVPGLNADDYTYTTAVYDASDDSQIYSESTSFNVDEPAVFSQSIDGPNDGELIQINPGQDTTDVNVSYSVKPETQDVSFKLYFDGNQIDSGSLLSSDSQTAYEVTQTDVGTGSHTVTLEGEDTYGNTKTTEHSFEIEKQGLFDLQINSPNIGEEIKTAENETTIDVNSSYTIETGDGNVNTTVYLNSQQIDTRSFTTTDVTRSFDLTLQDLPEQIHEITFEGTDEYGNTKNVSRSFEVVPTQQGPEINEFYATPQLREVKQGDSIDLYMAGTEGSDQIDYVNVTLTVDGTVEKYEVVPRSEMRIGSWTLALQSWAVKNWGDQAVDITIEAVDTLGRTVTSTLSVLSGESDPDPVVELTSPPDGYPFTQTENETELINLNWDITYGDDADRWELYLGREGERTAITNKSLGYVTGDSAKNSPAEGDTRSYSYMVNTSEVWGEQFGNYTWRVRQQYQNNSQEGTLDYSWAYDTRDFEIRRETTCPITTLNKPEKNQVIYGNRQTQQAYVPIEYEVRGQQEGNVKISVDEREIVNKRVPTGTDSDRLNQTLGIRDEPYTITMKYNPDVARCDTQTVTRTVSVDTVPPPDNQIELVYPDEGETVYQDIGTDVRWDVYTSNENPGSGNTTLTIENSNGDVVQTIRGVYNRPGDEMGFPGYWSAEVPTGTYSLYADTEFEDAENLNTEVVDVTVVNEERPVLKSVSQPANNSVFTQNQLINFSVNSQTYGEPAQTTIKYRKRDEYEGTELFTPIEQNQFTTKTYDAETTFEPGRYAWWVEWSINPTYTSDTYYFSVEGDDPAPPELNVIEPQQDGVYSIPDNQSEVNVTFEYDAEVFTTSDIPIKLQTTSKSEGLGNWTTIETVSQNSGDNNVYYTHDEALSSDGYAYRVLAEYPDEDFSTDVVGFAVGENETAPQPDEVETVDGADEGGYIAGVLNDAFNWMGGTVAGAVAGLGSTALLAIAAVLSAVAGILTTRWTEHVELGLAAMITAMLVFVVGGWFPPWIGVILFLIASGIFIYAIRRTHGGR